MSALEQQATVVTTAHSLHRGRWSKPRLSAGRVLPALLGSITLLVYCFTLTRWHSFDSVAYALNIRRFEQTGQAGWLLHPHHLIFNLLGWLCHRALLVLNPGVTTLEALQILTALFGALGVTALARWVWEATRSAWASLAAGIALAGSYAWWYGSTDGRANLAATAVLLLVLLALRRAHLRRSLGWPVLSGVLFAGSILLHESHILFLPVAVAVVALNGRRRRPLQRLAVTAAFGASLALATTIPYLVAVVGVKRLYTLEGARNWLLSYARQDTWWSFDIERNLWLDLQALHRALLGAELTPGYLSHPVLLWCVLVVLALVGMFRSSRQRRRNALSAAPLFGFCLYAAFFTIWDPGYFVHWIAPTAFLIALLGAGWGRFPGSKMPHSGLLAGIPLLACALMLGLATYGRAIAPRSVAGENPHQQVAETVGRVYDPRGLVVVTGMGDSAEAEVYIPYFGRMQTLALHQVWAEAGGNPTQAGQRLTQLIDRVLARGDRVYLLSEVLWGGAGRSELAARYGAETPRQISTLLRSYGKEHAGDAGSLALYRLLPPGTVATAASASLPPLRYSGDGAPEDRSAGSQ